MKYSIFLDSDIILDIALKREPFFSASARIFSMIEYKKIRGYTSSVIISNIYYILRKIESHKSAIKFISKLRLIISILPVNDRIIELALESKFKDFEDAIQCFTAVTENVDSLITRNIKDYKSSKIKVYTPEEYLQIMKRIIGA